MNTRRDDLTRLQRWLLREGFTSAALERATEDISRSGMQKIRSKSDVRRRTMRSIQRGACVLAKRYVRIDELFDFYTYDEWLADAGRDSSVGE
jgi:hypothetical protein